MIYLSVWLAFSGVFWLIFNGTFRWLVNSWLRDPFYSHGFIVAGICTVILVLNGLKIREVKKRFGGVFYLFLFPGILFLIAGYSIRFNFLIALSYVLLCAALNECMAAPADAGKIRVPLFLLVLVFPIPFLQEISGIFSYATAKASAVILKILFPSVIINGIEITIPPDVSFLIGSNCGGANSILAVLTITVLWLVVLRNSASVNYIMAAAAIPLGFLVNVLRIICIFVIAKSVSMDAAVRIWHDFAGYFFYVVALTMIFVLWRILVRKNGDAFEFRRLLIK